ncbi:MAG: 16S rRNA (cytosine(967)-C(5))-methyltransferase RsmB [Gammaproteobacteria bacterium]|nr:16S rRNA (cytosine(967)-C(5))-methyltransferase RsmB [Gammaproteobacteria bacterium]
MAKRPRGSDPRAAAARVLVQVRDKGRSLATALPAAQAELADARDAALVQELVYGTLRWYHRLDTFLGGLLRKPLKARDADLHCLLLIGLYQLDQLALPERVAVHETVQAVRTLDKDWARGLTNAVLRNFQRDRQQLGQAITGDEAAVYAHPRWLIERLQSDWPEHWQEILAANNMRPPFCLRINQQRMTRTEYLEVLAEQDIDASPIAETSQGVCLSKPLAVTRLPGFDAGNVSVQDGAAQLAAPLLQLQPGMRVLDACAAPGGKTAHMLELATQVEVTAIDIDAQRLDRIHENLGRLGLRAALLAGDAGRPADWWDGRSFDRILLDAPCSASGVIRRHPDIKMLRRPADIEVLVQRQAALLNALWPLLATGGMLLYCTCSVLAAENSRQIGDFLKQHKDASELPVMVACGQRCEHGRQILPGDNGMDGFYYACLTRTA